jgi:ribonuclease G
LSTDILVSSDPWENRVAILEDGRLAEIYVEREERVIGSIYKGKVVNVLPGMGASFCDIGLGRNAFLYVDDINKTPLNIGDVEVTSGRTGYTINEKVSRGDDVLVQIVKEPRGLKGARVSTNISLPGRYLILMPTGKFSGVSRKIESADERTRLKTIMKAIRPEGMATVVRTAAGGVSNAELIADLGVLIRMWHGILEQFKSSQAPALLHKDMNLVYKTARDFITPEVQNVWLDAPDEVEDVRDFMRLLGPQYVDRIKYYEGGKRLFADFKIDDEIARLMKPTVKLPSGGSIVIESTEALTVIDVNSGKFTGGKNLDDTIVRTNVEAASEIARQVRLRDIGGIIVCDFIDMGSETDRNRVIGALQEGLRKDRTRSTIQSFSPLGLLEFTRKRVGKDLGQQLRGKCPTCEGLGSVMSPESVTIDAFRSIASHRNGASQRVHIAAAPSVAAQADYWYEDEREQLSAQIGAPIDVYVDPAVHPEKPRVVFGDAGLPQFPPIRVGDEFEVELLNLRLPTATSAAAVVAGRLVEVENAINAVGKTIKIRVLDVDGNDILAEPRTPLEEQAAEARQGQKKRSRGGRRGGRKRTLTAEEQAEELRELAEEAEKGLGGRTAPIGISASAPAEDAPPKTAAQKAYDGVGTTGRKGREVTVTTLPGERLSASAPAGAKPSAGAPPADRPAMTTLPGEKLSGTAVGGALPGERLSGDRVAALHAVPAPAAPAARPAAAGAGTAAAASGGNAPAARNGETAETEDEAGRRRRRRRRGRGRGGLETAASAAAPAAGVAAVTADAEPDEDEDDAETGAVATDQPGAVGENGERKKRRRRRRRRGRGAGEGQPGIAAAGTETPQQPPLPDRQIISVGSDGSAQPTGETAPPAPSRAIAPWNRKRGDVAVEPPPPVITAPPERTEPVKAARPSRRRRTPEERALAYGGQLEAAAPVPALPASASQPRAQAEPEAAPAAPPEAPATAETTPATETAPAAKPARGRGRKPAAPEREVPVATVFAPVVPDPEDEPTAEAPPAAEAKPKRGRTATPRTAKPKAAAAPVEEPKVKPTTRARKTSAAAAPAAAKKAPARATAAKSTAAKKTSAAKAPARKAPAKKATAAKSTAAKAPATKAAASAKKATGTRKAAPAKKTAPSRKKR